VRIQDYAFVVLLKKDDLYELNFIGMKVPIAGVLKLVHTVKRYNFPEGSVNHIIKLLVDLDLRVRFYESQEKAWMEQSLERGVETVQGNRDGSWGMPTLDEYKTMYLGVRSILEQEESSQR